MKLNSLYLFTYKYIIHLRNIYLAFVKLHTEFLIFWIKRYEKKTTTKIDNYQFQSFFQIGLKNQQNVQRVSLSKEKVVNLVKDVFISAAERDIYTGDAVVVHVITKDGTTTERFPLRKDWKLLLYDVKDSTFSAMWMYSICKWLNEPFFSLHLFHWQVKIWLITSLNFVTLKFFNKWIVFFHII